ncbi:AAA family ATPase [Bradyrhizobium cenepequi]
MTDTSYRILSFAVEGILRVVAVHIKPDGRVLELTGRNRQGKSSIIDALWMALGGEKMIPDDPIHDGMELGRILVDIGDDSGLKYRVTRRIKAKEGGGFTPSLIVENADGAKASNPQQILNKLICSLSCDPLEFIGMKPKEQFDLLKRFVPGVDFDAIAAANQKDFDDRTDVNRDAKSKRTRADAITIDEKAPAARLDEAALVAELAAAGEKNAEVERFRAAQAARRQRADGLDASAEQKRKRIQELRAEIDRLELGEQEDEAAAADVRMEIADAGDEPTPVDTGDLQAKIAAARDANARFDAAERTRTEKERLIQEATVLERQSAALTKAMEDREKAKQDAIAEAKMPIAGITFGDGVVLLDGHPLGQASQAQKLSTAIAIAVALQPKLRFITTKNAALLDDDSWKALVDLAEQQDLLIIAETVNSSRPTAVVIEDGHVKGVARQAAE